MRLHFESVEDATRDSMGLGKHTQLARIDVASVSQSEMYHVVQQTAGHTMGNGMIRYTKTPPHVLAAVAPSSVHPITVHKALGHTHYALPLPTHNNSPASYICFYYAVPMFIVQCGKDHCENYVHYKHFSMHITIATHADAYRSSYY